MNNVIIVHGRPSKEIYYSSDFPSCSNFAWFPWLQKNLMINDIKADVPEMPFAFEPNYEIWKKEFERFDITNETIFVGHSAGASFLLRWLTESNGIKIKKVILVAPGSSLLAEGFESLDKNLNEKSGELIIFASDNDTESIQQNVKILNQTIKGTKTKVFKGYGHFVPADMGTDRFPELLDEILST